MSASEPRLVAFAPYGRSAGSSRVRVFEWIDHLGLDAVVHVFTEENAAGFKQIGRHPLRSIRRHRELAATEIDPDDVVLIHRELSPLSDGSEEERLLRAGARGIVDLDDGLQWDWGQGGRARRLQPKTPKVLRMVKAADVVIAGNDLIAEWAGQHASDVVVIPSCVEPSHYQQKFSYELHDPPIIGWIGSASTERHLTSWSAALLEAHDQYGAEVIVVGQPTGCMGDMEEISRRVEWTESSASSLPAEWDVGIMPLPDGLLERSKCAYKICQYGAASLPAVASPVGVNAEAGSIEAPAGSSGHELFRILGAPAEERRVMSAVLSKNVQQRFAYRSNASAFRAAVFGTAATPRSDSHLPVLEHLPSGDEQW